MENTEDYPKSYVYQVLIVSAAMTCLACPIIYLVTVLMKFALLLTLALSAANSAAIVT